MTYFEDTGSVIEAPIDEVWEYLVSDDHGKAHARNARSFEVRETVGPMSIVAAERLLNGRWSTFVTKSTDFPPFCVCNEEVEGDFAGTKFVLLYRPDGPLTRVDVYGDVRSSTLDPESARQTFLELLAGAYDDDMRAMRARRASK